MTEVRVKLHADIDTGVQNIWMSLNYDKKPTIGHILNQLKKNFNYDDDTSINLYLDEFWLPPWESSRILRENDCIKVEFDKKYDDQPKFSVSKIPKDTTTTTTTSSTLMQDMQRNNFLESFKKQLKSGKNELNEKTNLKTNDLNPQVLSHLQTKDDNVRRNSDVDENRYAFNIINRQQQQQSYSSNSSSSTSTQSTPISEKPNINNNNKQKGAHNNNNNNKKAKNVTPFVKTNNNNTTNGKNVNKNTKKSTDTAAALHKKFGIGNYAYLLSESNENVTDEQHKQNDDDDDEVKEKNLNKKNNNKGTTGSYNNNIDLIAQSINATAKTKWKNSNVDKQQHQLTSTVTNKHIRFESTSEDSSSSSSSSSSSEDEVELNNKKVNNQTQAKVVNNKINNNNNNNNTAKKQSPKQQKKQQQDGWQPMSKHEQLNMVNYNRSFTVQTPKSLDDFVKVFNTTKLNAPVDGDNIEKVVVEEKKENYSIDYDKLEPFSGIPSPNDLIAFKILEISSNFTPEISDYKHGVVLGYDEKTNEITLKLKNSSYNEVLNKPNKFTIIEEDEYVNDNDYETGYSKDDKKLSEVADEEDIITIDMNNLINVKKMDEKLEAKSNQQEQEQEQQQQQLPSDSSEKEQQEQEKQNLSNEEIKSDKSQN